MEAEGFVLWHVPGHKALQVALVDLGMLATVADEICFRCQWWAVGGWRVVCGLVYVLCFVFSRVMSCVSCCCLCFLLLLTMCNVAWACRRKSVTKRTTCTIGDLLIFCKSQSPSVFGDCLSCAFCQSLSQCPAQSGCCPFIVFLGDTI